MTSRQRWCAHRLIFSLQPQDGIHEVHCLDAKKLATSCVKARRKRAADRSIIVGLRGVTLAPNVTLAVDRVIRQQIKEKIVISEFDAALNSAQRLLPVHARHGCQCNAGVGNNHCLKG